MNDDLRLALALADAADAISMRGFHSKFTVRTKADRTPVTEVDEAVERAVREMLERERPDDAILGEEFGSVAAAAPGRRRWIIDPIDGTKNFIRGVPVFAALIALDGEVGVVSAPALHRRWWAARGEGAFCNGAQIRVSTVAALRDASSPASTARTTRWSAGAAARAASATSGRTCSWPRGRARSASTRWWRI